MTIIVKLLHINNPNLLKIVIETFWNNIKKNKDVLYLQNFTYINLDTQIII